MYGNQELLKLVCKPLAGTRSPSFRLQRYNSDFILEQNKFLATFASISSPESRVG